VNMPSALGWRRAPHTYDYYVDGLKGFGTYPQNAQHLAEDAVTLADPAVNFANYDNDGDGYVDALFIIHAGPGYEYTGDVNDIHSHAWSTSYPMSVDGVYAYGYSTEPEYWNSTGDMTCGVYAHEMGHAAFGLPDLYDYGYDSEGLGSWSLMAGGSWNGANGNSPAHPDAWSRVEMGAATATTLTSNLYGASIPAVENTPTIYRLWTNGTGGNQYFLVENRRQTGYDAALPSQGLLVYHIDDTQSGNDNQWYPPDHMSFGNYQVALEQADGLFDLEHNTDSGDSGDPFPGSTSRRTFDSTGTPSTRSYASANTYVAVNNISNSAATMTADLIVSSVGVTVTSPNTAVTWYIGDANSITWSSANFTENVDIHINRSYSGGAWEQIVSNTANDGSHSWTVTGVATTAARIRVQGHTTTTVNDVSDVNFTVAQRSITVTSPNTAVTWYAGEANNITWSSVGLTGTVNIDINRAYSGGTWESIVTGTANDGTHAWTVTTPATSAARIRVTSVTYPTVSDVSDANFTVAERTITVTNPNTAVTWVVGESQTITWTSANITGTVNIHINRSYSGGTWESIVAGTTNDGSHAWTVTSPLTTAARIRVTSVTYPTVSDVSDENFTIANRSITVTSPNTAVTWISGESNTITWTSANITGTVNIHINRSYSGGTWEQIIAGTPNDGSHAWTVTSPLTTAARIRVTSVSYPTVSDVSDADFTIAERTITVTSPNTVVTWYADELNDITWTSANITGTVSIHINRSYSGGTWESIVAGTANNGTHPWTVTLPVTAAARIRVTSDSYPAVSDISDANFAIIEWNDPPIITHKRLDDQNIEPFDVVAYVTDDAGGFVTRFHYRFVGATGYDSLLLAATINPDQYSVAATLPEGEYEYFVRVIDAGGLSASTSVLNFEVGAFCGLEQAYDDGSAEASHWSENVGYKWAVRFDAGVGSYVLSHARIGVSAENPTANYSALQVSLYLADGELGAPGTLLMTKSLGSLGNVVGGVPVDVDNWVDAVFTDEAGDPIVLTGDFYISISNPVENLYDAFLHDEDGTIAGRSFVYDPCEELWIDESDTGYDSARPGNRMIRVFGFSLTPPEIVASVIVGTSDIKLDWDSIGAPYYQVYSSLDSEGPFTELEGTTATNSFVDEDALTDEMKFYIVQTSVQP
jgi:M6 family metalloprotease-like protein